MVSFVTADEFLVRITKITSRIGVSWTHSPKFCFDLFLTQWIMAILSKGCKPDKFKSQNTLKLSYTNIWGLCSNFVAHMYGLAVYVKEGLPFAWDLSLQNCRTFLVLSSDFTSFSSLLLFLYQSPSSSLCTIFDSISSNIDDVLLINPSANVFVLGDFNLYHKDGITYSGRTDRPSELCYNFSISNDLTQLVNFPTRIPNCESHSPVLLVLFISFDALLVFVLQWLSLHLGNSDYVVVSVSIDFQSNSQQDTPVSSHSLWLFLCWLGLNKSKRAGLWESQLGVRVGKLTNWVRSFEIQKLYQSSPGRSVPPE